MDDKIKALVAAAKSTNQTAREIGIKKLNELGLDENGAPVSEKPVIKEDEPAPAKEKSKKPVKNKAPRKTKAKQTKKPEPKEVAPDYNCDDLIEKAKERRKKAKEAAKKRANEPQKQPATKNKEAVEKTATKIEKSVSKRVKKGEVSVAEIDKIISEYEEAIKRLRELRKKAESVSKMAKGGSVDRSKFREIDQEFQQIKESTCGCGKMEKGGEVDDFQVGNKVKIKSGYSQYDNKNAEIVRIMPDNKTLELKINHKAGNEYVKFEKNEVEKYGLGGKVVKRGGREYPTGSAWSVEHNKRNKSEHWEQYGMGGDVSRGLYKNSMQRLKDAGIQKIISITEANLRGQDYFMQSRVPAEWKEYSVFHVKYTPKVFNGGFPLSMLLFFANESQRDHLIGMLDKFDGSKSIQKYQRGGRATGKTVRANKKWKVTYSTVYGKKAERVIEMGPSSEVRDVQEQLKRLYFSPDDPKKIGSVHKIEEIK